jgi:hypothetical protein
MINECKVALVRLLVALCIFFCHVHRVLALDGNELLRYMHGSQTDISFAMGYVSGIADIMNDKVEVFTFIACIPDELQAEQFYDIVRQELEGDPSTRHFDAVALVAYTLSRAFPC